MTGKVEPANVDALEALARNDLCHRSTAIIPKGRQNSPSYCVPTLNPLELKIGWEGLSPRASNKRCRLSEENGIPEFANLAWILRLSLGLNPQLSSP